MAQQTYLTPEALQFSLRQSAGLIGRGSALRIAALAQSTPYQGRWNSVRFNWSAEPERVATFVPVRQDCPNFHWAS